MNQRPALIVVAGPNGSGKTTITEKLLRHEWMNGCEYINPDAIARDKFGDWNSPEAVIKAANFASELRYSCLKEQKSLAFETVFSTSEKIDFIKQAIACGYFIRLFFVCTDDPAINAMRVARRVMAGGHDVPIQKIISRYYKSIENSALSLKFVDRAYFYDNTEENHDPILLFRASEGKLAKLYNPVREWAKEILESLEK